MGTLRLSLVSTAAPDRPGSMRRYAEWVRAALAILPDDVRPAVTLVSLAAAPAPSRFSPRLANWLHHAGCALRVRAAVRRTRPDLVHILDGSHAYLANLLPRRLPVVATVHDLIPLLTVRGELSGPRPSAFGRWLWRLSLRGLRRCSRIASVSAATSRDLQRLAGIPGSNIAVLHLPVVDGGPSREASGGCEPTGQTEYPAADPEASSSPHSVRSVGSPISAAPSTSGLESACLCSRSPSAFSFPPSPLLPPPPFILHVGHNAAYKNREGVLRVFALLAAQSPARLVLAGPAPTADLRHRVAALGLGERVDWRTDIDDLELQDLYARAAVFLFPSLYEGFGWPPLEAMACGCPVVCSNAASLPEVVGEAALLADPEDHAALARHCLDVLSKSELRAELIRRGYENLKRFTVAGFAEQLAAAYVAALNPR